MKLVTETSRPIAHVAREFGVNEGTLGNWVNTYRREHVGDEPPLERPAFGFVVGTMVSPHRWS